MSRINLKRLITKREISSIIRDCVALSDSPISLWDASSNLLLGHEQKDYTQRYPVKGNGEVIGWVDGDDKASLLAAMISFAARTEYEKRALSRETLNKYKKLIRLHDMTEQIALSLASEEVARVAINQAVQSLKATGASIMLYSEEHNVLNIAAAYGDEYYPKTIMKDGGGIAAMIMKKGKAEIINDVDTDPRYIKGSNKVYSLMCAPLTYKGKSIGVFNVSSHEPYTYLAEDLKLLTSIASQTATALTNAQLFEQTRNYAKELETKNIQLETEIIQRKQSEKALRASEEKYRLHFENVLDVIYSVDAAFKIVTMSPSVEKIMGYTPEEIIGRTFTDLNLLTEDSLKRAVTDTMRIMDGERIDSAEYEFIAKDGSIKTGEVSSAPLFDKDKIVSIFSVARDITAKKKTEDTLRATTKFLDNIIESSLDCIIVSDARGTLARVNRYFLELLGYEAEDVLGKHMSEFTITEKGTFDLVAGVSIEIDQEYIDRQLHMVTLLREEKKVSNWETYLIRKDGRLVPMEVNINYLYNEHGERTGSVGIVRDITERRKADRQIKETRDFLDNIIESSLDFIVVSDRKGYLQRVNNYFLELTGYSKEEVLGKHISECAPPKTGNYELMSGELMEITQDFFDNHLAMMAMLRNEKKVANWESFYVRKDGKLIPVEQNIIYLYDHRGEKTGSVGISRDTTERKKAEKEIKTTRDFLENVITTSLDGIIVTDQSSTITMINRAAVNILGYSRDELLGHRIQGFLEVGGEVEERGKMIQKVLMEKGAVSGYEHVWRTKDGTFVDVEMSIALLQGQDKSLAGAVLSIQDITDRKQAEKRILDYQDQLRSLASQLTLTEEQERRSIATDLHDRIGQTLAISKIKLGALRASATSLGLDKDIDEIRDLVEQSIQDTRSLIFDLCPPFLYELGFEKALEWLLEDIQDQYGIITHLECDGKPYQLDDDLRILLYQSVRELFVNIVKHAQAQHARLSVQSDPTMLNLCVEDDGRGFDEPTKAFRFDKEGGFGLFRIQERFHYLGGEITIDSKPHQGTRISLVLPVKSSEHPYKEDVP